ncbi:MAG: UpxY family transcription antiterminator [Bacteroidales bacterium]|jgi:transcription antitermination factor NusG|nr:UpxY family transcription antiterminator [Bacteroidales bacterium]HNT41409.1 UpxY family transcription antiterminator [Tenuifilaceae bacterium]MBP8644225.1 UpxY family transcription antiterminator [Bacteroidales bacterium]HOA08672.1 UpxY family transcription antiterminator [Tenuifilaceae bacterium]HOC35492.1 UpxY family transcription antiterminator [Tenuifilaceae bacterium]
MDKGEANKRWYALYTKPRNEKKIYSRLVEKGVEAFLPLQKRLKQWSDRKKLVEEPLFRSYIFVRIDAREYYEVLNTPGIVRYITFEGKAVPIPDRQIEQVKQLLVQDLEIEPVEEQIPPGALVEVRFGNLMGITGELVEHAGKKKVIIRIDHVSHSLLVTLPKDYVARAV